MVETCLAVGSIPSTEYNSNNHKRSTGMPAAPPPPRSDGKSRLSILSQVHLPWMEGRAPARASFGAPFSGFQRMVRQKM